MHADSRGTDSSARRHATTANDSIPRRSVDLSLPRSIQASRPGSVAAFSPANLVAPSHAPSSSKRSSEDLLLSHGHHQILHAPRLAAESLLKGFISFASS